MGHQVGKVPHTQADAMQTEPMQSEKGLPRAGARGLVGNASDTAALRVCRQQCGGSGVQGGDGGVEGVPSVDRARRR